SVHRLGSLSIGCFCGLHIFSPGFDRGSLGGDGAVAGCEPDVSALALVPALGPAYGEILSRRYRRTSGSYCAVCDLPAGRPILLQAISDTRYGLVRSGMRHPGSVLLAQCVA